MTDSFGRRINYLRLSITDRCNLRCKYCMPEDGVAKLYHNDILNFEEIEKIARAFIDLGVDKIRLTGGEPLIRKNIMQLVNNLSLIKGLTDFSLTTNGILLKQYAKELVTAGIKRVNISIDTLSSERYAQITRGGDLVSVIEGMEEALNCGMKIKLNVVLIGGFNDDEVNRFAQITKDKEIDVRFIELMAIGETCNWDKRKFISNHLVLDTLPQMVQESEDDMSPATIYRIPGHAGRIGLISPISCKFCSHCNRVRLTSDGKLKMCLHTNDEIDLKEYVRSGNEEELKAVICEAIKNKPLGHELEKARYVKRNMFAIGG